MDEVITNLDSSPSQVNIILEPSSNQSTESESVSSTCSEESYTISSHSETISSISDIHIEQKSSILNSIANFFGRFNTIQGKIISISLIIVLIEIIIVMLAIKFTVLNPNQQLEKSSTSKTNPYFSTTVAANIPIIYDIGNGGASGDPPCSSHTVVNDPLRNINAYGTGGTCDNGPLFNTNIGGRWIRFVGAGGTIMSQTSPGLSHCGAFLTVWFNGTLPSTIGTLGSGRLCYVLGETDCEQNITTSIVNCGGFYVYFLPPVSLCNTRYCTV